VADPAPAALQLVADLVIEVGDERGSTTARVTSDDAGLVIDVADPAVLLRSVPRRVWPVGLGGSFPASQFAGIPARVTSRGRDLARLQLAETGRIRIRPALSGTPSLLRTAFSYRSGRIAAGLVVTAAVAVVVYLARGGSRTG
jgi:hypothetical protein